jgi:hypothetical protein
MGLFGLKRLRCALEREGLACSALLASSLSAVERAEVMGISKKGVCTSRSALGDEEGGPVICRALKWTKAWSNIILHRASCTKKEMGFILTRYSPPSPSLPQFSSCS